MRRYYSRNFDSVEFSNRIGLGLMAVFLLFLLLMVIKLLLPLWLLLGSFGAAWHVWRRHRQFQKQLYQCFYDCLKAHNGRISVLDFAIAAHITGPQARSFLDARAKDFFAEFETSAHGDLFYTFRSPMPSEQSSAIAKLP